MLLLAVSTEVRGGHSFEQAVGKVWISEKCILEEWVTPSRIMNKCDMIQLPSKWETYLNVLVFFFYKHCAHSKASVHLRVCLWTIL